jgi:nicotinate (nicotinamide) nucleotide adenylyltransferase
MFSIASGTFGLGALVYSFNKESLDKNLNLFQEIQSAEHSTCQNFNVETDYKFPTAKLKKPVPGRKSVVLVSCGSFNPPTNLHLQLLEGIKDHLEKTQDVDVILGVISPVHDAYGKKGLLPSEHRIQFVDICTKDSKWITMDTWEANRDKYSTTVTVLRHIDESVKANAPNSNIRTMLVCGADLLESFNRPGLWAPEDQEEILSKFGVCVLERGGLNLQELIYGNDVMYKNMV